MTLRTLRRFIDDYKLDMRLFQPWRREPLVLVALSLQPWQQQVRAYLLMRLRANVTVCAAEGHNTRREIVTRSTTILRTAAGFVYLLAMPALAQNSMDNMTTKSTMAAPAAHATSPSTTEEARESPATEAKEQKAMAAKHHVRKHHRRHHRHHTTATKKSTEPAKAM